MAQASDFPKSGDKGKRFTQVNWNVDQQLRRHVRLPVRLDGQDVRHRHRPPERDPGQRQDPLEVRHHQAGGGLHAQRDEGPLPGGHELGGPQRRGHRRQAPALRAGHRQVGQHRLRLAGAQARHRQGAEDDDHDGAAPGHRRADRVLPGGRDPRRQRHDAAHPGRLVRDARGRGQVLRAQPDPVDHDERQEADQAAGPTTASRSSARTSPTARASCSRASSRRAPAPRPSSRAVGPLPARRAPPTTTSSRGSSATRRSSPRPCGSAPPTARTG